MNQNFDSNSKMSRRINVFVPPISSFPELNLLGGYGLKDRIELPKTSAKHRPRSMEDVLEEREPHFLYVIDSKGRLLEHLRYFGEDYRSALRESFALDQDTQDTEDPKKMAEMTPMTAMDLVSDLPAQPATLVMDHPETQCPCTQ